MQKTCYVSVKSSMRIQSVKMERNLAVVFIISIFVLGAISTAIPVQAHFTLGDITGTYRYHAHDFDPHVPGVIGYVWPGGGPNTYGGFPNFANVNQPPGYQSPYPGGKPAGPGKTTVGGVSYPAPDSSWYQLEGDSYSPFGAVLAGSTGDLIFALNATAGSNPGGCMPGGTCRTTPPGSVANDGDKLGWSSVQIYLPPGFAMPMDGTTVVSTLTNSGVMSQILPVFVWDRYAPNWTLVTVNTDGGQSAGNNVGNGNGVNSAVSYFNRQYINFTSAGEWYYVRINGVTAPTVAGRYFFKIMLVGDSNYLAGPQGTSPNSTASLNGEAPTQFIPTENWPVLLVKGEIDPAIITGTIRYAGYNQSLYSQPVKEAGRVYAKMTTRLDPYTGQARPDLPKVDAQGYFNATAKGHYEVEGVAPGVYDLYASAAGYPQTLIASGVKILRGQSLHFDGYLQPGPVIHGNVFTKHQFGDEPWPNNEYVKIELYDQPTLNHLPDPNLNPVSWSPLPCIAGGQDLFFTRSHAGSCGTPLTASQIAFPWHEYVPNNGYFNGGGSPTTFNYYQVSESDHADASGNHASTSTLLQDPQGVGPHQNWFVTAGTTTPFHFEFGVKGEYGAPRDLDGMVPQVYATWINGLTPGRYYVRAWVFRYVQSALDGSTFQEYYFDVTSNEWAGDVTLPIDLRLSSWVNKTVHFHDTSNTIVEDPINTGAGFMTGWLLGADGNVYSYNQTALGLICLSAANPTQLCRQAGTPQVPFGVPLYPDKGGGGGWMETIPMYGGPGNGKNGVDAAGSGSSPGSGVNLDPALVNGNAIQIGRANIQFWGFNDTWSGENYGIPSGIYTPYTQVLGYVSQGPLEQVAVTLSGNPTSISDHMIRGLGFNVTVYSIDWQRPIVSRFWEFGNPVGWTLGDNYANNLVQQPQGCVVYSSQINQCLFRNVGAEIDLGAYRNGTLTDWTGDEPAAALASSIRSSNLYQNASSSSVQLNGGGFPIMNINGQLFDANQTWFGSEVKRPGNVGGVLIRVGGLGSFHNVKGLFIWPHMLTPTAFPQGQYEFGAFTYGYVQRQPVSVYAINGQIADAHINMMIGVNITVDILFKKERVITATSGNMSARIRLFNDNGQLVGEWLSSNGVCVSSTGNARAADGTAQYPFGPLHAVVPQPLPLNEYNYVPGGTVLLHAMIAGLPQVPAAGYDAPLGAPIGAYSSDSIFTPVFCEFDLGCYASGFTPTKTGPLQEPNNPGKYPQYPYPNTGILGAPDYQGGWSVEVDFVPWYANNTNTAEASSGGFQSRSSPNAYGQYYTPVNGLLMGESYHIIPGTTATTGISLVEDAAVSALGGMRCKGACDLLGPPHGMAFNHLGPYSQQGVWQIANAHNSGEASGIFQVDLNGLVSGNALAFNWANVFRTLSWGTITVTGTGLPSTGLNFYTYDGTYQAYLPGTRAGASGSNSYKFVISSPGYAPQTFNLAVSSGMTGTGANMYLQESNIPVPEFSSLIIAAFSALAASAYVLRRRHGPFLHEP